jgi:hypothetical protein
MNGTEVAFPHKAQDTQAYRRKEYKVIGIFTSVLGLREKSISQSVCFTHAAVVPHTHRILRLSDHGSEETVLTPLGTENRTRSAKPIPSLIELSSICTVRPLRKLKATVSSRLPAGNA